MSFLKETTAKNVAWVGRISNLFMNFWIPGVLGSRDSNSFARFLASYLLTMEWITLDLDELRVSCLRRWQTDARHLMYCQKVK
jgi:hypothetical protein